MIIKNRGNNIMDSKKLNEIIARKEEIRAKLESNDDVNIEELRAEIEKLNKEQAEIEERAKIAKEINENKIKSKIIDDDGGKKNMNDFASVEYRNAFMDYVKTGVMKEEFRATALVANNAVIPTNLLDKIVEKLEAYGNILPLVSKTSYASGVNIPVSEMGITATWQAENTVADKQATGIANVVFGGYKLQCRVATSLELGVRSISAFENFIVNSVSKAMIKALETAVVSGDGNGKPEGILTHGEADENTKKVEFTKFDYKTLAEAEGQIPTAYDSTAVYVMNKQTFMQFVGMTDTAGQPVARVSYGLDGKPERQLLGRTVVLSDAMPSVEAGKAFAFAFNMSDYVLNTNYDIGVRRYFDENTDENITKATLIADGKVVNADSLVLLVKKA